MIAGLFPFMMSSNLWPRPSERYRRFAFADADALYRDHRGKRIVADWSGPGFVHVVRSDVALQINGGRLDPGLFHRFAEFAVISAEGNGDVDLSLSTSHSSTQYSSGEALLEVHGCGYVLSSDAGFEVDGNGEQLFSIEGVPVPFFQSVSSARPMKVAQSPNATMKSLLCGSIDEPDLWAAVGTTIRNSSSIGMLESEFENGRPARKPIASHLNEFEFTIDVGERCQGLRILKTYDRFHGRQRARVLIDGQYVGEWYEPVQNRIRRWGAGAFGFEFTSPTSGELRLTIDPVAGSPLWSVSELQVLGAYDSA